MPIYFGFGILFYVTHHRDLHVLIKMVYQLCEIRVIFQYFTCSLYSCFLTIRNFSLFRLHISLILNFSNFISIMHLDNGSMELFSIDLKYEKGKHMIHEVINAWCIDTLHYVAP